MASRSHARRHTRDNVADAAMRILAELGLPDLTMRRLATELDVQPGALYWHFPSKQALLAELATRILAHADPGAVDGDWRTRVIVHAHRVRDALLGTRDGAEVVLGALAMGADASLLVDAAKDALADAGASDELSRTGASAVAHLVLAHVSMQQQRRQFADLGITVEGEAPLTATDASLDAALAVLLDGIAAGLV